MPKTQFDDSLAVKAAVSIEKTILHYGLVEPPTDTVGGQTKCSSSNSPEASVKTYEAHRNAEGELIVTINGQTLDPRLDLINHSPTGFGCGHGSNGAAQLALAILADHFGDDEQAMARYQDFKCKVVAGLPQDTWSLTHDQIRQALTSLEKREPLSP